MQLRRDEEKKARKVQRKENQNRPRNEDAQAFNSEQTKEIRERKGGTDRQRHRQMTQHEARK